MSLRVWLPLNGDLRNQGCSNLQFQLVSTNTSINASGKIGSCYTNNSRTAGGIVSTSKITLGQQHSMFCWFKFTSLTSSSTLGGGLVTTHWHGTNSGTGITIRYVSSTTGYLSVNTGNGSSRTYNTYYGTTLLQANTWYHGGFTYDGTNIKIYVNGNLEKTQAYANMSMPENYIGIHCWSLNSITPYADYKFIGSINDVRIYDHCLSAAEVHEIAQGLVLHYPLNQLNLEPIGTNLVTGVTKGGQTSLLTDGRVGVITSGTSADTYFTVNLSESITSGTTYYLSCDVSGVSQGQYWGFPLGTQSNTSMPSKFYNGHNVYIFTANDINWGTNRLFLDDNYRQDYAHPASFYNFVLIKNPTFKVTDNSGYHHHGSTTENLIFNFETERYSSSVKINSPSPTNNSETGIAYILSPLALTTPNQMTVAWWAKPESGYGGGTNNAAFCTSVNSRPTDYNSTAMHHRDASFDLCPSSGSSIRLTFNQYTANQWHHYAITYDGQTARAYKDGAMLTSASMAAASALKSFTSLWIGYSQAGGVKRKTLGSYSDFRVYVTALSADDILALYHTGAKVDNKQNLHAFELVENNSKIQINRRGQTLCNELEEDAATKFYKTNQIIDTNEIVEL